MIDQFGRSITYLRLSLTERCTLKCAYCRAGEGACPKQKELSAEDFLRIVSAAASLGINKVRLTGGEPMLRRDLIELIQGVCATSGISEVVMTTNGQQLSGRTSALKNAGLSRLNVSLDSLIPARYASMTGGGSLANVLSGVDEAMEAGLTPLKLNVVLMRGVNDDEAGAFIELTRARPIHVRFIELMPMGETDCSAQRVSNDKLLSAFPALMPVKDDAAGQPARMYQVDGYLGRVGLISPISHRFCEACNRVRVMSDGMLRPCLGSNREVSLRDALARPGTDALVAVMREAIYGKPRAHTFSEAFHTQKNMSRIGG